MRARSVQGSSRSSARDSLRSRRQEGGLRRAERRGTIKRSDVEPGARERIPPRTVLLQEEERFLVVGVPAARHALVVEEDGCWLINDAFSGRHHSQAVVRVVELHGQVI